MYVKVPVVGGKDVIENWEGGAACQCCTVQFHRIKDGTGRKMNQLDCNHGNVLFASDRGEGMSCPKETFHT